ncbi:MAG: SpoIIE family protein phosphatase [candidate division Zixibacteria bacterium]|nr:SpoIIE family protein phosphatase [candidate division Zixibacteria bacterium]
MLKLVGTDGRRFYSWALSPGRHTIGRSPDCQCYIPDKTVSRSHAEIEVSSDKADCFLKDLGSHNGTQLNGMAVTERIPIKIQDNITFGSTEFRIASAEEATAGSVERTTARLSEHDPQNSVFLSINEALKPLPQKVGDQPELLSTLFEMAKMLGGHEPQDVMLNRSLEMISRVIKAERLAVLFVSEDQSEVLTAACLLPGGRDPGAFSLSRTIVSEIITNKNAILISNPLDDPRFASQQSIIMSQLSSAVAVPLFDEGKVLGILYADTADPRHHYDDEQLRVLATFGNLVASRLLNYALMTERQEKHVLDAELKRASAIQKKLLVETPPELPGWDICAFQEQCQSVGGDLYDFRKLADDRLLFMVADVSGKGMGAALLMANILASFRILYESRRFDLALAVQRVSQQLFENSDPEDFATLFVGLIDPGDSTVRYINSGHNPPLLVRADGSHEHLEPSGIMIGAFGAFEWPEQTAKLEPGDLIFVFSDGVTEADRGGEQFGEKRTEQLVTAVRSEGSQQIVDKLMGSINEFMGEAPRSDDITILTVKRAIQ